MALVDVPAFAREAGHTVLSESQEDGAQVWLIRRGG
jgi:TusA-related sulfurtransferase